MTDLADPETSAAVAELPTPPTSTPDAPPTRRGRRNTLWLLALVVLVGIAGGAWWVGASSQSPEQAAAKAEEPPPSWITAPVELRVLSATLVTRGDVRPDTQTEITAPASVEGEPIVTQRPIGPGDVVREGDRVIEISGRPVFVLEGSAAIYRTLTPGAEGDDVEALQVALVRSGYTVDPTGVFDQATKGAVIEFYADAGYAPIPTSETFAADLAAADALVTSADAAVTAAQNAIDNAGEGPAASEIATADAAITNAENALEDARASRVEQTDLAENALDVAKASRDVVHATPGITVDEFNAANTAVHQAEVSLADTRRDTDAAVESAEDQLEIAQLARTELDDQIDLNELTTTLELAQTAAADARTTRDELIRVNGPTVPQGEVVFVTTTPTRVLDTNSDPEVPVEARTELLSLASGDPIVFASIGPDEVALVDVGADIELLDELTNTSYLATIAAVSDSAQQDETGQLAHPITITPSKPLPDDLIGANLRVTFTAASTETAQLVVPIAAVSAAADATTRVDVLDQTTGQPIEVAVTAGVSADGFIAIEPVNTGTIDESSLVVVGQ